MDSNLTPNRISENDALLKITQNFYKAIEIAIVDNFPGEKSDYLTFKINRDDEELPLWQVIEKHLASFIASWDEWRQVLSPEESQDQAETEAEDESQQELTSVPKKFKYFDDKILQTVEKIRSYLKDMIHEAIIASLERFEQHPPYAAACKEFRSYLYIDKLEQNPEALPFFDIWYPTRLQENITTEVLFKIEKELQSISDVRFPYNPQKDCFWNLALVIRLQIQILRTLREKIFGIIAIAEESFQEFFTQVLLEGELLPLIRNSLNNYSFISSISRK
ncbi:hypothetical protein [Candidatus Uabimicrobium amorphum]|uniref:Uncharacterized protein n=1 Tax=Uabimicrobium amorphum TaxID=2596890 RepID=A0A5S9ITN9_UABAM|nr:hypothetical protein [Candidatus Uabimicrobium amorphum]BBM86960.1 hypothetical protein UABAM_05362 [Candidatus Uabimicrobium amorphum]